MKPGNAVICPDGKTGIYVAKKGVLYKVLVDREDGGATFVLDDSISELPKGASVSDVVQQGYKDLQVYFRVANKR